MINVLDSRRKRERERVCFNFCVREWEFSCVKKHSLSPLEWNEESVCERERQQKREREKL